ncbi:MAG: hypothetical protein HQ511_07065 [Rhodospirillales bacterium]|nr:hypothetical protein [Rhodospirillales bacterium]
MKHIFRSTKAYTPTKVMAAGLLAVGMLAPTAASAGTLVDAVKNGTPLINLRYRYENVDMDGMSKEAHANTLRSRIGYQTDWWQDLQAMVEFENITVIGEENYNDTLNGKARPIVADPEDTELNQGFVVFRGIKDTTLKVGRQRIKVMNDRFVGNVGFRQNEQTFDSVLLVNTSIPNLTAVYSYVWNVNRIFGNDSPTGDLNTNTHWGHLSYKTPLGALTAYGLSIDLDHQNGGALAGLSTTTFGARFAGDYEVLDGLKALYAFDYAHQSDQGDNPADYSVDYYLIEPGLSFAGLTGKLGYEVLGSDWTNAFQTPLATLHAFQGATDVFLVTPARGIQDAYTKLSYKVANMGAFDDTVLSFMYHDFNSEAGHTNYGTEWDIKIGRKFKTDYGTISLAAEYADFNADNDSGMGYVDVQKTWLTVGVAY